MARKSVGVRSYTRRSKTGKVVHVSNYTQKRDLLDLLTQGGADGDSPPIAAKRGQFGGARQVAGQGVDAVSTPSGGRSSMGSSVGKAVAKASKPKKKSDAVRRTSPQALRKASSADLEQARQDVLSKHSDQGNWKSINSSQVKGADGTRLRAIEGELQRRQLGENAFTVSEKAKDRMVEDQAYAKQVTSAMFDMDPTAAELDQYAKSAGLSRDWVESQRPKSMADKSSSKASTDTSPTGSSQPESATPAAVEPETPSAAEQTEPEAPKRRLSETLTEDFVRQMQAAGYSTDPQAAAPDHPEDRTAEQVARSNRFKEIDDAVTRPNNSSTVDRMLHGEPGEVLLAAGVRRSAAEVEPETTALLQSIAGDTGGEMEGLQYRLKTTESMSRKIRDKAETKNISQQEYASKIGDALRYTAIYPADDRFTKGAQAMIDGLVAQGHEVIEIDNSFARGNDYRGVNSVLRAPNGTLWELQFHTPESLFVKMNYSHTLYETVRDLSKSDAEREEAYGKMVAVADMVPTPPNFEQFGDLGLRRDSRFAPMMTNGILRHPVTGQELSVPSGWELLRDNSPSRDTLVQISSDGAAAIRISPNGTTEAIDPNTFDVSKFNRVNLETGEETPMVGTGKKSTNAPNESDIARAMSSYGYSRAEAIAFLKSSGGFIQMSRLDTAAESLLSLSRTTRDDAAPTSNMGKTLAALLLSS